MFFECNFSWVRAVLRGTFSVVEHGFCKLAQTTCQRNLAWGEACVVETCASRIGRVLEGKGIEKAERKGVLGGVP